MSIKLFFLLVLVFSTGLLCDRVYIVATVENETISNIEVQRTANLLALMAGIDITAENEADFFNRATEHRINAILFKKKAEALDIIISSNEISKKFNDTNKSQRLLQYIEANNKNKDALTKEIESHIIEARIVSIEIIPNITINRMEIKDFEEQEYTQSITLFELAKIQNNEQSYLGLFSKIELNQGLLNSLEKIKKGDITYNNSIKLLDKIQTKKSSLNNKFNFIKVSADNASDLEKHLIKNKINCKYESEDMPKISRQKINHFTSDNTQNANALYKLLVTMQVGDISTITQEPDHTHFSLLLCEIESNRLTKVEIQEEIFKRKLEIEIKSYIRNLRSNSVINING